MWASQISHVRETKWCDWEERNRFRMNREWNEMTFSGQEWMPRDVWSHQTLMKRQRWLTQKLYFHSALNGCVNQSLPSIPKHLSTAFNHLLVPLLSMLISSCWFMDSSPLTSSSPHVYQQPLVKCVRCQSEVKVINENGRLSQRISRADLLIRFNGPVVFPLSSTHTWWPVQL